MSPHEPVLIGHQRWARIHRVRMERFVEFAFTVDDDDLMVDLVMPWPEFRAFCRTNDIELRSVDPAHADAVRALAFRHGDAEAVTLLSSVDRGGSR